MSSDLPDGEGRDTVTDLAGTGCRTTPDGEETVAGNGGDPDGSMTTLSCVRGGATRGKGADEVAGALAVAEAAS